MVSRPPIVLAIGGSDPTAGAGVQGDLRTIGQLGAYGVCALTSVTVQDTCGLSTRQDVAAELLTAQLTALAGDLRIATVKAGMLGSRANVEAVARFLDRPPPASPSSSTRSSPPPPAGRSSMQTPPPPSSPSCCRAPPSSPPTCPRRCC